MKLWIDEDLSPTLVAVCHEAGHQATSVRDRVVEVDENGGCSDYEWP